MKASPIQILSFLFYSKSTCKQATDFLKHSLRCCGSSSLRQREKEQQGIEGSLLQNTEQGQFFISFKKRESV